MANAPRKTIGGREFIFGTLPAPDALKIELAIAPVLAEAIAAFGAGATDKPSDQEELIATARAAGEVMKRMAAEDFTAPDGSRHMGVQSIMETVFAHTTVVVKPSPRPVMLADFTGKPKEKYLVLVEALKANFADFFPAAASGSSPPESGSEEASSP